MAQQNSSLGSSTNTIREVFGYINRFKNQVFVLRIEDSLLDSALLPLLIKDVVLINNMGIKIIVVPGAKESIDRVLTTYGEPIESHNNIRVTTKKALPLVKLGASNVSNRLLTLFSENNANGVSGNWVKAREVGVIDGIDYQHSGKVESIKSLVIQRLLENNLIPIISNIGWNAVGKPYNISSMELAVETAKVMQASKLFFIGASKGVPELENCKISTLKIGNNGVFSSIELNQAYQLIRDHKNDLAFEDLERITAAVSACRGGVNRVHIIDGARDGILLREIFSSSGCGTMFHTNVHTNIRPAKQNDIPEILHIMQQYVEHGVLVQRTAREIGKTLESYFVYEVDETVHGCGALDYYSGNLAEIKAIVVDPHYKNQGTGKKIVSYLLDKAKNRGVNTIFILTTQSSDFFTNLGFKETSVDVLPDERKTGYNKKRKSKVLAKVL